MFEQASYKNRASSEARYLCRGMVTMWSKFSAIETIAGAWRRTRAPGARIWRLMCGTFWCTAVFARTVVAQRMRTVSLNVKKTTDTKAGIKLGTVLANSTLHQSSIWSVARLGLRSATEYFPRTEYKRQLKQRKERSMQTLNQDMTSFPFDTLPIGQTADDTEWWLLGNTAVFDQYDQPDLLTPHSVKPAANDEIYENLYPLPS